MGRKQKLFPLPLIVMMRYSATRVKKKRDSSASGGEGGGSRRRRVRSMSRWLVGARHQVALASSSTSLRRKSLTSAGSRREKAAAVSLGNLDTRIPAPCPRLRSTCNARHKTNPGQRQPKSGIFFSKQQHKVLRRYGRRRRPWHAP